MAAETFCPFRVLKNSKLRPTRQRLAIIRILFGTGHRHVSAESLHAEVIQAGETLSLATVYNSLHQFKDAGLVRAIAVPGERTFFDTNTADHAHFYEADQGQLIDIPDGCLQVYGIPQPPPGLKVSHVDVVISIMTTAQGQFRNHR
jgi:Fur family iron response transcriptional regulator